MTEFNVVKEENESRKRPGFLPKIILKETDITSLSSPLGQGEKLNLFQEMDALQDLTEEPNPEEIESLRRKSEFQMVGSIDIWFSFFYLIKSAGEPPDKLLTQLNLAFNYFSDRYGLTDADQAKIQAFIDGFQNQLRSITSLREKIVNPVDLVFSKSTADNPFSTFEEVPQNSVPESYSPEAHKINYMKSLFGDGFDESKIDLTEIDIRFHPGIIAEIRVSSAEVMHQILDILRLRKKMVAADDWRAFTSEYSGQPYIVVCEAGNKLDSVNSDLVFLHEYRHAFDRCIDTNSLGFMDDFDQLSERVKSGEIGAPQLESEFRSLFGAQSESRKVFLDSIKRELLGFIIIFDNIQQISDKIFKNQGYGLTSVIRQRIESWSNPVLKQTALTFIDGLISELNDLGLEALQAVEKLDDFGLNRDQTAALFTPSDATIANWAIISKRFVDDWKLLAIN